MRFSSCLVLWLGLWLGGEMTNQHPSVTLASLFGLGPVTTRVLYIQPTQHPYSPMIQVGGSVRLF